MDAEDRALLDRIVSKWSNEVAGLADNQGINVSSMCHCSGVTTSWRSTAGEFRTLLQNAYARAIEDDDYRLHAEFAAGHAIDFCYHDYYGVEVVTPEVKARDDQEALLWQQINDLKALGVDMELFVNWEHNPNGEVKFTPEKVVELADIIRGYLLSRAKITV